MALDLSIVICAYNAEKTIERTLQSIEPLMRIGTKIIVVDDDSVDDTYELIEQFRQNYPSLELLRIPRMGSAGARNKGLSLVESKYVMFCDSDDEIVASSFAPLMLQDPSVDFLVFDYQLVQFDHAVINKTFEKSTREIYSQELCLETKNIFLEEMGYWRYIYRTSFLRDNQLRFVGELDEIDADFFVLDDYFFLLGVLSCATSHAYFPEAVYRYYSNSAASFDRFRRQSRFMARAANIQMTELSGILKNDSKVWFGFRLSEQLFSSLSVIKLSDSFRESFSFTKAIWRSDRRFASAPISKALKNSFKVVLILARKVILELLR
jgi:glycosyltransferase involved in cell wall biosynthesis